MTTKAGTRLLILALTAGWAGCDGGTSSVPTAPSVTSSPPPPLPAPGAPVLRDVTLSGVVYEETPTGRVPIEGVDVYCEPCGAETHSWASTDSNGFYSFTGVWVESLPTRLWIGKDGYADPAGLPRPTPPNPAGPGWREVRIDGDTRFDVQLVRW